MSTVILGGGIIGLSTAYYLSHSQSCPKIRIIDSSPNLLLSASGFAGGFLAKDWFASSSAPLGALSFRLHRELADEYDGWRQWGYSGSTAYSLSIDRKASSSRGRRKGESKKDEDWLTEGTSRSEAANGAREENGREGEGVEGVAKADDLLYPDGTPRWISRQEGGSVDVISSEEGCAQVEPRELCEYLVEECRKRGVEVHLGTKATGVVTAEDGTVRSVKVETGGGVEELEVENIVIAAGAWTPRVFRTLFPTSKVRIPIDPLAGHSIVVRHPRYSKPIIDPAKHEEEVGSVRGPDWDFAPEAISRVPKAGKPEVYVAGLNSSAMQLPELASDVKAMIDQGSMEDLKKATVQLTGLSKEGDDLSVDDLEVVREGLCFRPAGRGGKPIIAKVNDKDLGKNIQTDEKGGVYIAAGHGPWGISLSLGTGLVVSEMIQGKKTSADVRGLGLSRSSW